MDMPKMEMAGMPALPEMKMPDMMAMPAFSPPGLPSWLGGPSPVPPRLHVRVLAHKQHKYAEITRAGD